MTLFVSFFSLHVFFPELFDESVYTSSILTVCVHLMIRISNCLSLPIEAFNLIYLRSYITSSLRKIVYSERK